MANRVLKRIAVRHDAAPAQIALAWLLQQNVVVISKVSILKHVDPAVQKTAIVFYAIGLFLPAFAYVLIWLYATRNHRLVHKNLDDGFITYLTRRYLGTIALYLAAVLLSMLHGLADAPEATLSRL